MLHGVAEVDYLVEVAPVGVVIGGENVEVGDVGDVAAVAVAEYHVVAAELAPDE